KASSFSDELSGSPTVIDIPEEYAEAAAAAREHMIERIAETDDELTMKFLEGEEITNEELYAALRKAVCTNEIVPILCGTALRNKGVQLLLDAVVRYLPSPKDVPAVQGTDPDTGATIERGPNDDEPFAGLVFKIVTDPFVGRLAYIRVYSGVLRSGETVYNSNRGRRERIGRLVRMHADKREDVKEVLAGDIAAIV